MRRVEGTVTRPSQDLTHLNEQPTNKSIITITEALPKEKGFQAPHQGPQPRNPTPRRQATTTSGFEGQKGLRAGEQEGCGKDSAVSGMCRISYTQKPRTEATVWKKPGLDLHTDLREAPKRQEITLRAPMLVAAILGMSFYHKDTGAGNAILGSTR